MSGPAGINGANGFALGGGLSGNYITVASSLLATNVPGGNGCGAHSDAGHNLSSDATCGFTNIGSLNNTDPKLGVLSNNGGPTLTLALLPGSPAIDAGDITAVPPTDQRGILRPFGPAADIGAYEYAPLLRIDRAPGNAINLLLRDGTPGQTCRLLASTNNSDWWPQATNQTAADGKALFPAAVDLLQAQTFYRTVSP